MKTFVLSAVAASMSATVQAAGPITHLPLTVEYRDCSPNLAGPNSITFGDWVYDINPFDGIDDTGIITMTGSLEVTKSIPILYTFNLAGATVPSTATTFNTGTITVDVDVGSGWVNYNVIDASVTNFAFTTGVAVPCHTTTAGMQVSPPAGSYTFAGVYPNDATIILPPGMFGGALYFAGTLTW